MPVELFKQKARSKLETQGKSVDNKDIGNILYEHKVDTMRKKDSYLFV